MLFTSFAQNQPNACEDRTKIFCDLIFVTVLKIPESFVRKPWKREAKKFIKFRKFPEPGSRFSNSSVGVPFAASDQSNQLQSAHICIFSV